MGVADEDIGIIAFVRRERPLHAFFLILLDDLILTQGRGHSKYAVPGAIHVQTSKTAGYGTLPASGSLVKLSVV